MVSPDPFHPEKFALHAGLIAQLAQNKMAAPQTIEIDVTDGLCNQRCGHCCFASGQGRTLEKINIPSTIQALTEAYDMGTRTVELVGGGEPTMHPEIATLVEKISTIGQGDMQVSLVTNGLLVARILAVAKKLTFVRISLDTSNPSTYSRMHGVPEAHFHRVVANIAALRSSVTTQKGEIRLGLAYLVVPPLNHSTNEILSGAHLAHD